MRETKGSERFRKVYLLNKGFILFFKNASHRTLSQTSYSALLISHFYLNTSTLPKTAQAHLCTN